MKVVLAHGCFDILHPGHVSHLEAARAMGDYLIVGITGDAYVQKGPGRPAVCAEDRGRAVAALRCVDEFIIDNHPTPEGLIAVVKPAIFVKGADYAGQPIPEQAWVARYGGEVRFTGGTTMYHSRQWLTGDARALMEAQGVRVADLLAVLDQAATYRIHVVGDVIVDEYVQGELIGPLTLQVQESRRYLGGAGAVALHAEAAGAPVTLTCPFAWSDTDRFLHAELASTTIQIPRIREGRPTPLKTRYHGENGLLCQVDLVDSSPLGAEVIADCAAALRTVPADAVIFADYRHGVFHAESIPVLRAAIPEGALHVADSQVASRWGNIADFSGFDLATPNEREARWALGDQDSAALALALRIQERGWFGQLLLTRGSEGLVGVDEDDNTFTVPALSTQAVDPVGAGDALLAYATLGLLATGRLDVAAWLGSVAAAIACSRRGNAPVTAAEVRAWLERL